MVSIEFGQNPRVSLKNSASFLVSGSAEGSRGLTKGIRDIFIVFLGSQETKNIWLQPIVLPLSGWEIWLLKAITPQD
jgi:hypothetical protein